MAELRGKTAWLPFAPAPATVRGVRSSVMFHCRRGLILWWHWSLIASSEAKPWRPLNLIIASLCHASHHHFGPFFLVILLWWWWGKWRKRSAQAVFKWNLQVQLERIRQADSLDRIRVILNDTNLSDINQLPETWCHRANTLYPSLITGPITLLIWPSLPPPLPPPFSLCSLPPPQTTWEGFGGKRTAQAWDALCVHLVLKNEEHYY